MSTKKPWPIIPMVCERCEGRVDAQLIIDVKGQHRLEITPLKVTTASRDQELLYWAILCTDCVPSFQEMAQREFSDAQFEWTIDAQDAERLKKLLRLES